MHLIQTSIEGVYVVELDPVADERGFFARCWDHDRIVEYGLDPQLSLMAVTFNPQAGTLRGMHYQLAPFAETKWVRVTRGAVFDVALDLRKNSSTYLKWHGEILSAENRRQLYIPKGCAHGYMTLEPNSELTYLLSSPYSADHARGVRYNDPRFDIRWPGEVQCISSRDASYPDYTD